MRALLSIVLTLGVLLAASAPVNAQDTADELRDAEGRGLFEAGRAAFADGRYEDALDYYDRAYELTHRPELLYNIGSAYDRLRRDREALAAFEEYRRALPDAVNAREVDARMRVLRDAIAHDQVASLPAIAAHVEPSPSAAPPSTEHATEPESTTTASAEPPATASPAPVEHHDDGPGLIGEWWLWAIVGVVAAGGIVLGVVLATQNGSTTYPPYQVGDNGAVVMALTGRLP